MGNQFIGEYSQKDPCELYLEDLGDISSESTLGNGRLLKSAKCWHEEGFYVVAKVYLKQPTRENVLNSNTSSGSSNSETDKKTTGKTTSGSNKDKIQDISLTSIRKKLIEMNEKLLLTKHTNILPYFRVLETDKAGYLVRQFVSTNLFNRISTRPFLNEVSKKWITFQILKGIDQLHSKSLNLYHGDLKRENILLSGWDWVFLTDLAPFKPLLVSLSNTQSVFGYFFDTSERRKTTLAPERIEDKIYGNELNFAQKSDIFSVGCIIAQLFLEGRELFEFSQLLEYKNGKKEYVENMLKEIKDKGVHDFIKVLLSVDPKKRWSARICLARFKKLCESKFGYFTILHMVFSHLLLCDDEQKLQIINDVYDDIIHVFLGYEVLKNSKLDLFLQKGKSYLSKKVLRKSKLPPPGPGKSTGASKKKSKEKEDSSAQKPKIADIKTLIEETKQMNMFIKKEGVTSYNSKIHSHISKISYNHLSPISDISSMDDMISKDNESSQHDSLKKLTGCDMLSSLICICVRNSRVSANHKIIGLNLIQKLARNSTDYTLLQRLLPYCCTFLGTKVSNTSAPSNSSELNNNNSVIRITAIQTLYHILKRVEKIPQSETNLFSDYILSILKPLVHDDSEIVRICFARYLPFFAEQSMRYLQLEKLAKSKLPAKKQKQCKGDFDEKLTYLRNEFTSILSELTKDKSVYVKISLLENIHKFCVFCDRRKTNDSVVPVLITFLNSDSWRLRGKFFVSISKIGKIVGKSAVKTFLLPFLHQSITDTSEYVVHCVISSITKLIKEELLNRSDILELKDEILPLVIHPNNWIKYSSISFLVALKKEIGVVDTYCFVIPSLKRYLKQYELFSNTFEFINISQNNLIECLKTPLSRKIYDLALKRKGLPPQRLFPKEVSFEEDKKSFEQNFEGVKSEWSHLLNKKLSKSQICKLELLKEHIALSGSIMRRKTMKKSFTQQVQRPTSQSSTTSGVSDDGKSTFEDALMKVKTLREDGLNQKELEIIRRTFMNQQNKNFTTGIMSVPSRNSQNTKKKKKSLTNKDLIGNGDINDPLEVTIARKNLLSKERKKFEPKGELFCEAKEHSDEITCLKYLSKRNLLVSGSKDYTLKVWDIGGIYNNTNYNLISKLTYMCDKNIGYITNVNYFPQNSNLVFSTSKGCVQVFDLNSQSISNTALIYNVNSAQSKIKFVNSNDLDNIGNYTKSFGSNVSINVVKIFYVHNTPIILAGSQTGKIHALDSRSNSEIFQLNLKNVGWNNMGTQESLKQGPISAICGNDKTFWIVSGSKRGFLTLWDLRFQMSLSNWRISSSSINDIIYKENFEKNLGPTIYVASSSKDIVGWNLETERTTCILSSSDPNEPNLKYSDINYLKLKLQKAATSTTQKPDPTKSDIKREESRTKLIKAAQKAHEKIKTSPEKSEKQQRIEVDSFQVFDAKLNQKKDPFGIEEIEKISWDNIQSKYEIKTLEMNFEEDGTFFSAGTDRKIRLWDVNNPNSSYVISGLRPNERAIYKQFRSSNQFPVIKEYIVEQKNENEKHGTFNLPVATYHMDSILDLTVIQNKNAGEKKLVSADKDGVLKFWD